MVFFIGGLRNSLSQCFERIPGYSDPGLFGDGKMSGGSRAVTIRIADEILFDGAALILSCGLQCRHPFSISEIQIGTSGQELLDEKDAVGSDRSIDGGTSVFVTPVDVGSFLKESFDLFRCVGSDGIVEPGLE